MISRKKLAIIAITASSLFLSTNPAFAGTTLNGSGATFAQPLIDACKADYAADTGNTVNYPGGGSARGRTDFSAGLVDFAGSDAPYSSGAPSNLIYAPIYAAPLALMYNLPTVKEPIYLTPVTIAKIFSGVIIKWNDPAIVADNERVVKTPIYKTKKVKVKVKGKKNKYTTKTVPALDSKGQAIVASYDTKTISVEMPNEQITVWYRSDGSGSTENFGRFLNGSLAGTANERFWPKAQNQSFNAMLPSTGGVFYYFQAASGSAAVSAGVKGKVGSITYSELSFATANKLPVAYVQNANGDFVEPAAAGTSIFLGGGTINANGTVDVDFKKKLPGAYPLGTASYGMAYSSGKDAAKQAAVASWFTYVLEKCATKYPEKGFAQITGPLAAKAKEQIAKIK